jgi:hypothetical protein
VPLAVHVEREFLAHGASSLKAGRNRSSKIGSGKR